jgi:DNA adenine methylase
LPSEAARYLSPLRYPGGKGRLAKFVGELMARQPHKPTRYVEPFAGGAGVGLRLLFDEYADEIILNDLNPGIAAFWRALFNEPEVLLERLAASRPTIDEWHRQSAIYAEKPPDAADLGFATFFLNRTNRSGILNARPIGGLEQTGKWTIAARFDKDALAQRIRRLANYASRVTICEEDGVTLLERHLGDDELFAYADPPYLVQGDDLYLDTFSWSDHQRLAELLRGHHDGWFLTYDDDPRIPGDLYRGMRCAQFSTSHTAAVQHVGCEYAVFAHDLQVDSLASLGSDPAEWVTVAGTA